MGESSLSSLTGVTAVYLAALILNNDTLSQFSGFPDTTGIEESMDETDAVGWRSLRGSTFMISMRFKTDDV